MVGDVDGKTSVIIDDMISTASTLVVAADLLVDRGAAQVHAAATHGVFAGEAIERILASSISKVYVTDTIHSPAPSSATGSKSSPSPPSSPKPSCASTKTSPSALFHIAHPSS